MAQEYTLLIFKHIIAQHTAGPLPTPESEKCDATQPFLVYPSATANISDLYLLETEEYACHGAACMRDTL